MCSAADFKRSLSAQLAASIFNVSLRLAGFAKHKKTWLIVILYTCPIHLYAQKRFSSSRLFYVLRNSLSVSRALSLNEHKRLCPLRFFLCGYVPVMPISDTWQKPLSLPALNQNLIAINPMITSIFICEFGFNLFISQLNAIACHCWLENICIFSCSKKKGLSNVVKI